MIHEVTQWLIASWNNTTYKQLTDCMALIMIIVSLLVVLMLTLVKAPYGRYSSSNWGPPLDARLAWFIQELPSFAIPLFYICSVEKPAMANVIFLCMYLAHYTQRALVYPFLIKGGKPTPIIPFLLAFVFCLYNGLLQSWTLLKTKTYSEDYLYKPQIIIGMAIFVLGMCINIHSDHILRNLRKPGEVGYKIPKGGMFTFVSGANFFGEIVEWTGYAIACATFSASAFAIFTALNIGPRALQHHSWYKSKFEDYPKDRAALIPFLL